MAVMEAQVNKATEPMFSVPFNTYDLAKMFFSKVHEMTLNHWSNIDALCMASLKMASFVFTAMDQVIQNMLAECSQESYQNGSSDDLIWAL